MTELLLLTTILGIAFALYYGIFALFGPVGLIIAVILLKL